MTGLIRDPKVLERATNALLSSSSYQRGTSLPKGVLFPQSPALSEDDQTALNALYSALKELCAEAKRTGVRIDLDAEQVRILRLNLILPLNSVLDLVSASVCPFS